jgi:hypothetical protein
MSIQQALASFWHGMPRFLNTPNPRRRNRLSTAPAMESLEPRQLLSAVAGDPGDQAVTTGIDVEFTDNTGGVIDRVRHGDSFQINVFTRDLRDVPLGVVAAFVDVIYDTDVIDVTNIVHHYQLGADGRIDDPAGIVDDAGGGRLDTPASSERQLLLSLSATAIMPCELTVRTRAADGADAVTALAGLDTDQRERTLFGQATLTVEPRYDSGQPGRCDLNGDGQISFADLAIFASVFGRSADSSCHAAMSDIDGNGQVGFGDMVRIAEVFGQQIEDDTTGDDDAITQLPQSGRRSIAAEPVAAVISDDHDSTSTAAQTADELVPVLAESPRSDMLTATCTHTGDAESCDHEDDEAGSDPNVEETDLSLTSIRGDVLNDDMPSL